MYDTLTQIGNSRQALGELADELGLPTLIFYRDIGSTQDVLRSAAGSGAPAWTMVVADHQHEGRGQEGRRWRSIPGALLQFSLLLRPASTGAMALLPIRSGLAIADAVDAVRCEYGISSVPTIRIKWPNDLMLEDRKVAGILSEGVVRGDEWWSVVGIGINAFPVTFDGNDADGFEAGFVGPTEAAGVNRSFRLDLLKRIVRSLRERAPFESDALESDELDGFAERDWLRGRRIESPSAGRVAGIDRHGHLIVEDSAGRIERAVAGRVRLADRN